MYKYDVKKISGTGSKTYCIVVSYLYFVCRGVGCIFYEMASGRPLFPGATVEDELHLIFKVTLHSLFCVNAIVFDLCEI